MTKRDREIMEILAAFDLTGCPWSAARLAGPRPSSATSSAATRAPVASNPPAAPG